MSGAIGKRWRAIRCSKRWRWNASAKNANKPAKPKSQRKKLPLQQKPTNLLFRFGRELKGILYKTTLDAYYDCGWLCHRSVFGDSRQLLYEQESTKPQKMVLEELEVLRKKEKGLDYRKVYKPQLQEIAAKAEARKLADWKVNFPWKPTHDTANKFVPERHLSDLRNAQGDLFDSMEQFWEHYNDYNAPHKEDIHAVDNHVRL